ncbi:hypothetical protein [Sediminitomix flava]|uniref:Uncharacterized protein n=1 Tax=Sediminitomix flava TaxID=379075 RepID=A0A315Z949_SEDFL|nr:hypothetical protein [Sediminitomix flava]PWJ40056.1 hypothetical protein BC781_105119 [Sediminitomix flava]
MNDLLKQFFLVPHIITGAVALIAGICAILLSSKIKWHKKAGSIFKWSLGICLLTALILSLLLSNLNLGLIGIFSSYLLYSGIRCLSWKKDRKRSFDLKFLSIFIPIFLTMLITAYFLPHYIIPLIPFGSIGLIMVSFDLYHLYYPAKLNSNLLLKKHIGRMGGAFIATITAALVTNLGHTWLAWLMPTIIGSLFITFFQVKISLKQKKLKVKNLA